MTLGPRALPAVHQLIGDARLVAIADDLGRERVLAAMRAELDELRQSLIVGDGTKGPERDASAASGAMDIAESSAANGANPSAVAKDLRDAVIVGTLARLSALRRPRPQRVINATGVILHTNLGRAPVSAAAARAMAEAAAGYSDLEFDLATGERGSRHSLLDGLLAETTGAEAGFVVNNNAGATLLVLAALAAGKDVLVSRGQLIEIGDGFRLPAIFEAGGARLVEVGTTNRTKLGDYESALDASVALILRVHTSNYKVVGFTEEVGIAALAALGRRAEVPVVDDLGSGSLLDTSAYGLAREPIVGASLAAGADLVTFSGDKLLGGPQAGVIVGRRDLIQRLRRHPLARALRPGKDVIAGLHATLLSYASGKAAEEIPVWRMIAATPESLAARAAQWQQALASRGVRCELIAGESTIGGGSLPGETLPTTLLGLTLDMVSSTGGRGEHGGTSAGEVAARLRTGAVPVVGRIANGRVLLDPRTVQAGEDAALVAAVVRAVGAVQAAGAVAEVAAVERAGTVSNP